MSGSSNSAESPKVEKSVNIEETHSEDELKENDVPTRNRSASIGAVPKNHHLTQLNRPENRTMVFLLSRHDIRLISLNRKQILLHKFFVDVLNCVQGVKNGDHFGVICKESAYKGIDPILLKINYGLYI